MFKKLLLILFCVFLTSCTSSIQNSHDPRTAVSKSPDSMILKPQIQSPQGVAEEDIDLAIGLIFAKTIFEGVVKTSYVELVIANQDNPNQKFQLIIGDKERQKSFPWEVQTVRPGYFFIELPDGRYRIESMAIPVATTKAQETVDIVFEVKAKAATYLGTLNVNGTKERMRLGGVPVLQPGFEYSLAIVDEEAEAYSEFQSRFPEYSNPVVTNLMQAIKASNVDANPS